MHDQPVRIAADRDVDDEDPQRHANLRRRQPDPRRRVHRLDHVVDEPIDVRRDGVDGLGPVVEDGVAVFENRSNHVDERRSNAEPAEAAKNTLLGKAVHDSLDAILDSHLTLKLISRPSFSFECRRYESSCAL